jgi:predicted metalloprotease with PDZ domain
VIALLLVVAFAQGAAASEAHYALRFDRGLETIDIVATLPAGTTRLYMDSVQAQHLNRGWATFVERIDAEADGRRLAATPVEGAAWTLPSGIRGPVTVTYRINLGFTRAPWPAGNEQAGAGFENSLYIVGRALFITGNIGSPAIVELAAPAGWHVSTPLVPVGNDGRTFRARDATELTRNALVVGRHPRVRIRSGPFDLELALPGQPATVTTLVEPVLRRVLESYLRLFPRTPETRYLMTFFVAAADDGEAFTNSASFTATESPTSDGTIVWGNFLAHELMHFWNGQRIRGTGARATWRWFAEGFSEYYANVTLAREGLISRELFMKKAERHLGNYLYFATSPARPRLSLVEAGSNTGVHRFGVYDGGWVAAFCIDGLIREGSGDRRSLDDLMSALWARVESEGSGYSVAVLDDLVRELAGGSVRQTVSGYVETSVPMPVTACLARLGLRAALKGYAAEAFVSEDPQASPERVARRESFLGRVGGVR